ncbi:MAG: hypothetical protein OEW08_03100 [Gammaproteobacteria bacterium]|nr:hypothetical protein [Gammaproteobacteria bacterium]
MTLEIVNQRCIELFFHPRVQAMGWYVELYWQLPDCARCSPLALNTPKVDLIELEVLLATVANTPSWYANKLDRQLPTRSEFIRTAVKHGRLPLLRPYVADSCLAAVA